MFRTGFNRVERIAIPITLCILLAGHPALMRNAAGQLITERPGNVERGGARHGEIGRQECLWGDWRLEAYSNASGAETAERVRFGRNDVAFSSRQVSGHMRYEFFPTLTGAEINVYDPRFVGPLVPGSRVRGTGATTVTMLTNNVFSFRTAEGSTSTYRKVVPRRNYLVVHVQKPHDLLPGHIFIQMFSVDPGSRRLINSRARGFYPDTPDKKEYMNWDVVENGMPGILRDEVNDPVLRDNGHHFYSDDMFIIEVSDMDMRRVDELIRAWETHPPTCHGIGLNCITFVLAALRTLRDRPVTMSENLVSLPDEVMVWIRMGHGDLELTADEIFADDGYIPCYPWK